MKKQANELDYTLELFIKDHDLHHNTYYPGENIEGIVRFVFSKESFTKHRPLAGTPHIYFKGYEKCFGGFGGLSFREKTFRMRDFFTSKTSIGPLQTFLPHKVADDTPMREYLWCFSIKLSKSLIPSIEVHDNKGELLACIKYTMVATIEFGNSAPGLGARLRSAAADIVLVGMDSKNEKWNSLISSALIISSKDSKRYGKPHAQPCFPFSMKNDLEIRCKLDSNNVRMGDELGVKLQVHNPSKYEIKAVNVALIQRVQVDIGPDENSLKKTLVAESIKKQRTTPYIGPFFESAHRSRGNDVITFQLPKHNSTAIQEFEHVLNYDSDGKTNEYPLVKYPTNDGYEGWNRFDKDALVPSCTAMYFAVTHELRVSLQLGWKREVSAALPITLWPAKLPPRPGIDV